MQGSQSLLSVQEPEQRAFIKIIIKISKSSKSQQYIDYFYQGLQACLRRNLPSLKHPLFLRYRCFSWLLLRVVGLEEPCPWLLPRKSFHWHLLQLWKQWELRRLSGFVHLYLFHVLRETPFNTWFDSQIE